MIDDVLFRQLQQTLDSDPNNSFFHFNLGLFLWKKGEEVEAEEESKRSREKAAEHFLASAKLNPNDGAAFRFLGHYYGRVSTDAQRACKCYQRAVTLNPDDCEAGEGLCDLLDGEGKESLEIAVCKEASSKSPRAFWAFRRLGYLQVHQRRWSESVQSLQHAIRGYPACADLWEALGLAYQRLGMFTAAIKSYGRATELDSSKIFALIESGNIQLMLGSFRKGVEQFRCALEVAPQNLSAKFGLSAGLLALARDCVNSGAFDWAATLLKEASEVAKVCTCLSGNLSSAWKLHGDIQITYAKCFPWEDKMNSMEIDEEIFKSSINQWKDTCLLAAKSGKCSYGRALHLTPWQANIYADIAVSLDLIDSLEGEKTRDLGVWQLPERMCLGGLMLEGVNKEFWVILGCLSSSNSLKQHALIRGLQLDVSLSEAWAYLGKIYRNLGDKQLARQAFDRARSIDPSLALAWAGMSVDYQDGISSKSEAFESCLRAVQMLPLAEFQVGLGTIAALTGHLHSPQVLGAIRQAVQRAPYSPESHNVNGLICEERLDFLSAITAYRKARCALNIFCNLKADSQSHFADVSFNLARSLCKAGLATDALRECEDLKREGLLESKGLQLYAVALWKIGQYDAALIIARNLAENVTTMDHKCATAALELISTLMYSISGNNSAVATIQKFPSQFLLSARMRFIICALNALEPSKELQLLLRRMPQRDTSYDVATEMHSIIALSKMMNHDCEQKLITGNGLGHLKRALHIYPDSSLIRNQLGSLLLSSGDWMAPHKATRCTQLPHGNPSWKGLRSPYEIHGAAVVACYASCSTIPNFSFTTCKDWHVHRKRGIYHLQRWVHQEPWNRDASYLLILGVLQKACEEKFPEKNCTILRRLIQNALLNEIFLQQTVLWQYQKSNLLLCSSEISLQHGDYVGCISHASNALGVIPPDSDPLFAHLQLCRAYGMQENFSDLDKEYMKCLRINATNEIGWIILKYIESRYRLEKGSNIIEKNLQTCIKQKGSSSSFWVALFNLACAQCFIWDLDYLSAEQAMTRACAEFDADTCLLLCHGAICMELARQQISPQFISRAAGSLRKAQKNSANPLPIVSLLLAQAEASLGAKPKWEMNVRLEWFSWPPETRPAELYFQMHLLASHSSAASNQRPGPEKLQSPEKWILRAIHMDPSCLRYWKVLQKPIER
ncbi:tetratricopeptide repeat protein SKI3 isoform X1 [Typha latifolia]|uniref:tetratricopeptide repeat protein SKI3 isoform X1 n=2 Tax=Typha latifolia TaxID=4733 RepID=UPI003C2AB396